MTRASETQTEPVREPSVLIIDDDHFIAEILADLIARNHDVPVAFDTEPLAALERMSGHVPDLVITDFDMPEMDGVAVVERLRASPRTRDVPVLMITGMNDPELRIRAMDAGANDVIRKPFEVAEVRTRVRNMLAISEGQKALKRRADDLSSQVEDQVRAIREREQETILRLAVAAEYRDGDTQAHLKRISRYARAVCVGLNLDPAFAEAVELAAPMHDIGKIGIPEEILARRGRLSPDEMEVMKSHTTIGHRILDGSSSALLRLAAEAALSHHERWDGSGYPKGLRGEDIPLVGRIVAVADVFDALTTERPYKEAWETRDAIRYLAENAGVLFDPDCVRAFLSQSETLDGIRDLADAADVQV